MRRRGFNRKGHRLAMFMLAVTALVGGYYWGNQHAPSAPETGNLHRLATPRTVQPFLLTDQNEEPFTQARLNNHWSLVMFGYRDPEETSRSHLLLATRIYNRLASSPKLQQTLQVVFITLDPARDTPEALGAYVGHYSSEFIALSGAIDDIDRLAAQLGVKIRRISGIEHGTSMALINPNGELVGLFNGVVSPQIMANDIKLEAENR